MISLIRRVSLCIFMTISFLSSHSLGAQYTFDINGYVRYYDKIADKFKPLRGVAIKVYDQDKEPNDSTDDLLAEGITQEDDGAFNFLSITADEPNGGDLYFVILLENKASTISYAWNPTIVTYRHVPTTNDPTKPYRIDFPNVTSSDLTLNGAAYILDTITDAYNWLEWKTGWKRATPIFVEMYPNQAGDSNFDSIILKKEIHLFSSDIWNSTKIVHEYGHAVMYAAYGSRLPAPRGKKHKRIIETDPQFALTEGWAEFFPCAVYNSPARLSYGPGAKYVDGTSYPDHGNSDIETNEWWRGETFDDTDSKDANDGEKIEGAVASILWDIFDGVNDDEIDSKLLKLWSILLNDNPNSIREIWDAWVSGDYGSLGHLHNIYYDNGINYDHSAPVVASILAFPSLESSNGGILFTVNATDNITPPQDLEFSYLVRGQDDYSTGWSAWSSNNKPSYSGLSDGTYILYVQARDHVGNTTTIFDSWIFFKVNKKYGLPSAHSGGPYSGYKDEAITFIGYASDNGSIIQYQWSFGDGKFSYEQNPKHIYSSTGTLPVTLTVTDNDGNQASETTIATIRNKPATTGDLFVTSAPVSNARIWIDGVDTGQSTSATFTLPTGYHDVMVRKNGYLDTFKPNRQVLEGKTINVDSNMGRDLTATVFTTANQIMLGQPIGLDGSGSSPASNITRYVWTDSTGETIPEVATYSIVFKNAGTHTIRLTIYDGLGDPVNTSAQIIVFDPATASIEVDDGIDNDGDSLIDEGFKSTIIEKNIVTATGLTIIELGGCIYNYQKLSSNTFSGTKTGRPNDTVDIGSTHTFNPSASPNTFTQLEVGSATSAVFKFKSKFSKGNDGLTSQNLWLNLKQTKVAGNDYYYSYNAMGSAPAFTDSWGGYKDGTIGIPSSALSSSFTLNSAIGDWSLDEVPYIFMTNMRLWLEIPSPGSTIMITTQDAAGNQISGEIFVLPKTSPFPISVSSGNFSHTFHVGEVYTVSFGPIVGYTSPDAVTFTLDANGKVITGIYQVHNQPPVAKAGDDQMGQTGTLVSLDGTDSFDPDNYPVTPLTYSWRQTSGESVTLTSSTTAKTTFTPNIAGDYLFELAVSDSDLIAKDTVLVQVVPNNQAPTALFTVSASPVEVGSQVGFDATGTFDPDGTIVNYVWGFGDGTPTQSGQTLSNSSHTFARVGTYDITLTVTDDDGGKDSHTIQVIVQELSDSTPPIIQLISLEIVGRVKDLTVTEVIVKATRIPVANGYFSHNVKIDRDPEYIGINATNFDGLSSTRNLIIE